MWSCGSQCCQRNINIQHQQLLHCKYRHKPNSLFSKSSDKGHSSIIIFTNTLLVRSKISKGELHKGEPIQCSAATQTISIHCSTMPAVKRLAVCTTRCGSQEINITFTSTMQIRLNPSLAFETQRRRRQKSKTGGASGPKIGHVNVSAKINLRTTVSNIAKH